MNRRYSAPELNARLADNAQALAAELLPEGKRQGHVLTCGDVYGNPGGSFSFYLAGPKKGHGWDGAEGNKHYDPLALIQENRGLKSFPETCRWAEQWLGVASGKRVPGSPAPRSSTLRLGPTAHATGIEVAKRTEAAVLKAWRQWQRGETLARTQSEAYLHARGIPLDTWPEALRFLPEWNGRLPSLMAQISAPDGNFRAVQWTYLDRAGMPRKAPEEQRRHANRNGEPALLKPRMVPKGLPIGGCAIRLAPAGERLIVAEGVETALSARLLLDPGLPAWAALGGCMSGIVIPSGVQEVIIAADNDRPDPKTGRQAGRDHANSLARRLLAEGRRVKILFPPGGEKDWNDRLQVLLSAAHAPRVTP